MHLEAHAALLSEAAREPVRSWLSSSPSAFVHGSESTGGVQRHSDDYDGKSATQGRHEAGPPGLRICAEMAARCSFEMHPVTLRFRDRAVEMLFDGRRAACELPSYPRCRLHCRLSAWLCPCDV